MAMTIEPIHYGPWKQAFRCTYGNVSLVAVADVGPRVMHFGFVDGPNILFEDREGKFRRKDWFLYGGHRFWVGPETENAFHPENSPCSTRVSEMTLSLVAPSDAMGMQRRLDIRPGLNGQGFCLRHAVVNQGGLLLPGCIWTLTCVLPHPVVVPWGAGSSRWQCNMVRYWVRWENHQTDPAGPQWHPGKDHFLLTPTEEEGKVGLYTEGKFVALLRPDSTFLKVHRPLTYATYPDGGCNVELYTRSDFVELETLSPLTTFHPGTEYVHEEQWELLEDTFTPETWRQLPHHLSAQANA